ncbi:UDP-galactopyranose mutase [Methanobacterium oryzae]|uniref:UDP-galactopyranose mutase n=1 Tax=Methanobacterium oryzae TaxID=69540 RepID=UPI003D20840F
MSEYIIIGAGLAGIVLAERISTILDRKVLIIEKRDHIGGNCFDYYNNEGILVHKYGPHIFHTESKEVWNYLSNFTKWNEYQHKVLGYIDGKKVPIPFNLNTLKELLPKKSTVIKDKLIEKFGFNIKVPILDLRETKEKDLKFLANFVYEKVFFNYTKKQWGMKPEGLDPSVTARVPVYISKDNRYFQDKYQGMPKKDYTAIFEKMLRNENIKIMLNTSFKDVISIDFEKNKIYFQDHEFKGKLIFTGKIDEFFNYKFGELPYRSLKFDFETLNKEYFQEVGTVNYPNDHDFTRITEFKHLTRQKHPKTTIVKEYPQVHDRNVQGKDIPYYPIPKKENEELYAKYKEEAGKWDNIIFVGRLAEYKYYNMDIVVSRALNIFKEQIANE